MELNDHHFKPRNKAMSVSSIPFGHPSHPGNTFFMANTYERQGTCEVRPAGGGEAANGSHAAWSRNRGCSKEWAVDEKTKFKEGTRIEGRLSLVPLRKGVKGPARLISPHEGI